MSLGPRASDPALAMALALVLAWSLGWELLSLASLTLPSPVFHVYEHLDIRQLRCQLHIILSSYRPVVVILSLRPSNNPAAQSTALLAHRTSKTHRISSHHVTSHHTHDAPSCLAHGPPMSLL